MPRRSRLSAGPALMLTPDVDDVEWARAHASDLTGASASEEEGVVNVVTEEVAPLQPSVDAVTEDAQPSESEPVVAPVPPAQLRLQELEKQNARMRMELEATRQKFVLDQERTRMELELEKERLKVQRLALELDLERQRQLMPPPPPVSAAPSTQASSSTSGVVRQNRGPAPSSVPIPAGMTKKAAARQAQAQSAAAPTPVAPAPTASQPSVRAKPAPVNKVVDRNASPKPANVYKGAQPREHVSMDAALYASESRFVRTPESATGNRREQRDRALPESAAFGIGMGSRPMPYNPSVQQRAVGGLF